MIYIKTIYNIVSDNAMKSGNMIFLIDILHFLLTIPIDNRLSNHIWTLTRYAVHQSTLIHDFNGQEALIDLHVKNLTTPEDWNDQSPEFQTETPQVVDFTEEDPFSLGNNL